jgi:hypothetical protein
MKELNEKEMKLIKKKMDEQMNILRFSRYGQNHLFNLADFFYNYKFSVDFIDKFLYKHRKTIDGLSYDEREIWRKCIVNIIVFQKLSEEFMEKHKGILMWQLILRNQDVSGDFIERHIDSFYLLGDKPYENVFKYGKFSYDFAVKHMDELEYEKLIGLLRQNTRISQEEFESLYTALNILKNT